MVVALGIVLVTVFVLQWIVSLILTSRLRAEARDAFAPVPPPREAIMCDTGPSPACAAKAAGTARSTVAWIHPPTGYQLQWLAAIGSKDRRGVAFEYLVSDRFALELATNADPTRPLDYNAHLEATFEIDGMRVAAYVPDDLTYPELTLAWSHERLQYRLYVMPLSLFDPPVIDPADFAPFVASVRYADLPA